MIHLHPAQQIDPSTWGDYAVKLLGAGGVAMLLREVVKQIFVRASQNDENRRITRADQAAQIANLIARVDVLDARVDAERKRANELFAVNAELRAENTGLRTRYHNLINWIAQQPGLPDPPSWLYERVEGPTMREAAPKQPESQSRSGDQA